MVHIFGTLVHSTSNDCDCAQLLNLSFVHSQAKCRHKWGTAVFPNVSTHIQEEQWHHNEQTIVQTVYKCTESELQCTSVQSLNYSAVCTLCRQQWIAWEPEQGFCQRQGLVDCCMILHSSIHFMRYKYEKLNVCISFYFS